MRDFEKVLLGVTNYAVYKMMRENGNAANKLKHFKDHEEMEKQYLDGISPDEIGRAMIDSQCGVLQ
jgi:hypothetical protein